MTGFALFRSAADRDALLVLLENRDPDPVRRAVGAARKTAREFALLLSPGAEALLEEMAERACRITFARFGRTIGLYAPLYLSNRCIGRCPYCGFRAGDPIVRRTLDAEEIRGEVRAIRRSGLKDLLLVAGESPGDVTVEYLARAVEIVREEAPGVSVEVAPLETEDYRALAAAGASGVTLYQETFDEPRYRALHAAGPKADFDRRLGTLDRAGAAGMRRLTTGALLGLSPWRPEALAVGLHAAALQHRWWKSQVSVGLPRLHDVPDGFHIPHPVDDRSLVQIIVALRIFLEDVGIAISTREPAGLRNNLLGLGVTHVSAGSRTEPGGYSAEGVSGSQFEVADRRQPREVAAALSGMGYDPVWKDWDYGFDGRRA